MVTLLNANDAFPRSQTTPLRLYNVHVIHDIGRHMNWMLVSQAVIHLSSYVKTSGQFDYSLLEKSALLFVLIVPLLWSLEECLWYCN